jgi:ABC-type lipoprotein export system ATPase subunit
MSKILELDDVWREYRNDPNTVVALLGDERMGNLDSSTGQEIVALLRNMVKREGKSLIVITHDLRLADVADLRLYIRDGRVTL